MQKFFILDRKFQIHTIQWKFSEMICVLNLQPTICNAINYSIHIIIDLFRFNSNKNDNRNDYFIEKYEKTKCNCLMHNLTRSSSICVFWTNAPKVVVGKSIFCSLNIQIFITLAVKITSILINCIYFKWIKCVIIKYNCVNVQKTSIWEWFPPVMEYI